MTGMLNDSASLRAVITEKKQSSMLLAAITTFGASPWLPNIAMSRSPCSTLVGSPVLGPPRCTLITTSGISAIAASPIASSFSE
jgi:hypothetical protein